jgi:hypothetical protein
MVSSYDYYGLKLAGILLGKLPKSAVGGAEFVISPCSGSVIPSIAFSPFSRSQTLRKERLPGLYLDLLGSELFSALSGPFRTKSLPERVALVPVSGLRPALESSNLCNEVIIFRGWPATELVRGFLIVLDKAVRPSAVRAASVKGAPSPKSPYTFLSQFKGFSVKIFSNCIKKSLLYLKFPAEC